MADEPDPLLRSLLTAVEAAPADVALRVHVAEVLLARERPAEAAQHAAAALQQAPADATALHVLQRAGVALSDRGADDDPRERAGATDGGVGPAPPRAHEGGFDWSQAEAELGDVVPPMFVDGSSPDDEVAEDGAGEVERPRVRLADVAGMEQVKARLDAAFLAPLRNPELARLYRLSLRGGLLLYGPPGCGKTFLARAVAGELGARFVPVGITDVVDPFLGQTEQRLSAVFESARRSAPCVLFLDEVDALGQKRSQLRHSGLRTAVNQLLVELDGVAERSEGVFVLAATNAPWDVDPALRRPGRLDRTLLVLPPDVEARAAVLRLHLRDRPVAGVDVDALAARTDGFSGADLAHVCDAAVEIALIDSATSDRPRLVTQDDLLEALDDVRPSTGPWFDVARNAAAFANADGSYDELADYLRTGRRRPWRRRR